MKLSMQKVESARNFANKLWNATRFVLGNLNEGYTAQDAAHAAGAWKKDPSALTLPDRWILSRHNRLIGDVTKLIDEYQFGEAGRQMYEFLWGEFCDWYIEIAKAPLYGEDEAAAAQTQAVLVYVLERTLRLLHPFMPFVTEEIWQHLPHEGEALIIAPWPTADALDERAESDMGPIMEMVRAIRNARAEYDVEPSRQIAAVVVAGDKCDLVASQSPVLLRLARVDETKLRIEPELQEKPAKALDLVVSGYEVFLPLAELVDLERERARLSTELQRVQQEMARTEKLLGNPGFVSKAKPEVVDKERAKLEDSRQRQAKLTERLQALTG
jgi:valyl-tRNA synthetase